MNQTIPLIRAITEANATKGMTIENSCLAVIDFEDFICMCKWIKGCSVFDAGEKKGLLVRLHPITALAGTPATKLSVAATRH